MKTGLGQKLKHWSILEHRIPLMVACVPRITFYEEMLTRNYILSKPDRCPIKTAPAVDRAGYYPTVSCVRYDTARDTHNVSMEEFVLRERSDPGPPAQLAPPTLTSSGG